MVASKGITASGEYAFDMRRYKTHSWITVLLPATQFLPVTGANVLASDLSDRISEPIAVAGSRLQRLQGVPVDRVAAFRWVSDQWEALPVQIDERMVTDFAAVYGFPTIGITTLAYTDANTFTGPDVDPGFDADDELVFMARDGGTSRASDRVPPLGAMVGNAIELLVEDPLAQESHYVYLFEMDTATSQWEPQYLPDYVDYEFHLIAGFYPDDYNTLAGPNPEDSEIVTDFYRTHFSDRWTRDELNILVGSSSGVDILDRHTSLFGPGICQRSEDTFSNGEGAFFANIDGPVRAIRSYLGANSGPLTQRDHFFYDQRQEIVTTLRVHEIPGVMDLYDYSPDAAGMTYFTEQNPLGVLVDGVEDLALAGTSAWELITGDQGSLVMVHEVETDIATLTYTSYYEDNEFPLSTPCTGDAFRFGFSGVWVNDIVPSTDPQIADPRFLQTRRTVLYDAPGRISADADTFAAQVLNPLVVRVRPYPPALGDVNADCFVNDSDYVRLNACLTGPAFSGDPNCAATDMDLDAIITLMDYASLQLAFTGNGDPVSNCDP